VEDFAGQGGRQQQTARAATWALPCWACSELGGTERGVLSGGCAQPAAVKATAAQRWRGQARDSKRGRRWEAGSSSCLWVPL
jgi:hypothetical protein